MYVTWNLIGQGQTASRALGMVPDFLPIGISTAFVLDRFECAGVNLFVPSRGNEKPACRNG
jgi:hypothetical protein